mmetsp:Transcript_442/g.805  ORF Transcript_442/g.805 Transcript_442/m.805 type:complete len:188 (+) Transcript_442:44-607(+)
MSEAAAASASFQDDLGAVGCVQVCVTYLDAAVLEQRDDNMIEETTVLCEAACFLLNHVCKGNVMNQRALLLSGALRRMVALLRSPSLPVHRAVVSSLHTASGQSGKEEKLFQDELHRCNGVLGAGAVGTTPTRQKPSIHPFVRRAQIVRGTFKERASRYSVAGCCGARLRVLRGALELGAGIAGWWC